jgi:hypothetical protein
MVLHKALRNKLNAIILDAGFRHNENDTYFKVLKSGVKMKIDMRKNNIKITKNQFKNMSISLKSLNENAELQEKLINYIYRHKGL